MKFYNLLVVELTKIKRSQALLMTLLCPLSVVLLQLMVVIEGGGRQIAEKGWQQYWLGATSLWYMLMLPLFIALITTLINAIEHKHSGWRYMASMPVQQWQLFVAKLVIAWLFVILASIVMYCLTGVSISFMMLLGYQGEQAFESPFLAHLLSIAITCLPILVIGHVVSWRWKNVVVPLGLGIVMTMGAMTLVRSEQYWRFDPWTYHMTSTMVQDMAVKAEAEQLSVIVAAIALLIGIFWLGRREVK